MKKLIINLGFILGVSTMVVGCTDYLDSDYLFEERVNIENVFQSKDYTNEWLAKGYAYMNHDYLQQVNSKKNTSFNFADDMYYIDLNYVDWKGGNYTEKGLGSGNSLYIWQAAYQAIRHISIFIHNVDGNKELTEAEITDMKGQAHFLRAYFYWMLIRSFGPVPIVPDEGVDYTKEYDDIAYPRNTYDECADYIAEELVKAATMLDDERDVQNIVRPTRGAALALRSRVLLYAASPLYNGQAPSEVIDALVDKSGRKLLSDTYDNRKWARAAAAAKDVMELKRYQLYVAYKRESDDMAYPTTITPPDDNGTFHSQDWPYGWKNIDPFESYRSLFDGEVGAYNNDEIIFTRGVNQGAENIRVMVIHQLPRSQGGGYNCHGMTQKQCDAYYMKDGSDCPGMNSMYKGMEGYTDPSRYNEQPRVSGVVETSVLSNYPELGRLGKGVSKQYANREPRFYASVHYNGRPVLSAITVDDRNYFSSDKNKDGFGRAEYYYSGSSGAGTQMTDFTGYNVAKKVSTSSSIRNDQAVYRPYIHIRYAEILLNYMEAMNEYNPEDPKIITYFNEIRERAGIPNITVTYPQDLGDKEKMREWILRERQIELAFEGDRFWTLARRLLYEKEENRKIYRMNVLADDQGQGFAFEGFYERKLLQTRYWDNKMYLYPIAQTEIDRGRGLVQNPGW